LEDRLTPGWWSGRSKGGRVGASALLGLVTVLLTVVIVTPVALSSQDLIDWAASPGGLNLPGPWPALVFVSLDAAAAVCVLLTVYCAWRGERAGVFGLLVWCFALGSAFANWRHSSAPGAAPDAVWFFPAMSLAGPALLEAVFGRFRRWAQRDHGRRAKPTPTYGWRRWTPGLGSLRDTYGAYRTALLRGIDTVEESITAYHTLCPDGCLRIAAALRHRDSQTIPTPARRQRHPPALTPPAPTPASAAATPEPGRGADGRARDPLTVPHALHGSNGGPIAADLPEALMRRIPVRPGAYQRWRAVWEELRRDGGADPRAIADRHHLSLRQVEFIRRAGNARLLESTIPPALRDSSRHRVGDDQAAQPPAGRDPDAGGEQGGPRRHRNDPDI
jgi:hypothetical protein